MFINMDKESKITLTATNKQGWPNMANSTFNTFRQSEHSLCDVFLRGDDEMEPIPAQRHVLAANSLYFNAMFASGFVESKPDHREISIGGVDTEILSFIVEFLYVGSCRLPSGTMRRVMDLLAASNMLQVDELSRACTIYLEKCLDSDSALELWLSAESCRVSDLAETFKKFVQSYFRSISRSQRVLELDLQDMAALLGLEEVNLGNAANEDTLVELLLRWLTNNPKALDSNLLPVLSKICWSEASQECKDKFREKLAEISKDSSSESFQAEEVFDISKSSSLNQSFNRNFSCSVCAIEGLQNSRAGRRCPQTSSMEVADIDRRTGTVLRQWSGEFKGGYCFLQYHGNLYVSSNSYHRDNKHIDVLCLSVADVMNANLKVPKTRSWDVGSVWWDLFHKQEYAHAIDEERGIVYLCGCASHNFPALPKQVLKLDIENNDCTELTSLPAVRAHHTAIVVEGDLFVLGGEEDWSWSGTYNPVSTVLKYDWMNNEWKEVSPMLDPRTNGAYACVDGKIYASGGSTSVDHSRNVEVYDPSLDIWTKLSPMSVPRDNHRLVAVGKYLFAMGGESFTEEDGACSWIILNTVERYSITEGCWEAAWEMAKFRQEIMAFTV
ncbi:kelch-like protein 8 [Strongylocentrotus purpuratus]|uniref:BTB domain-containing protein n=1 Tax=Strongylocentrotus purpuratus TaxID=7668 RepID=A0A7M7NT30_STRPU|nr:kelch-like protein 8 [Strongylocentrotus purpuratus]